MRAAMAIVVVMASAGCLRATTFQCENDGECGAGGKCEPTSYCSFADSSCAGMGDRRYGDHSGPNSGQCTGGGSTGSEPNFTEAGMEMPPMGCPGNYAALPNSGSRGHRYRLLNQDRSWNAQRDECASMNTFMAFPDGPDAALELAALRTLAGDGTWIGVNDQLVEGQYRTSLNMPVSAQTMALFSLPGGANNQDCFIINNANIEHTSCTDNDRRAVCECVP